jgi:predicted nucleic acid-binding protein
VLYADASALLKLVMREPETAAVAALLHEGPEVVSSVVGWVETVLVAATGAGEEGARRARRVLAEATILDLTTPIRERAAGLVGLRTLDAIHLATALALGGALEGLLTYDRRLAQAASAAGLPVLAPQ